MAKTYTKFNSAFKYEDLESKLSGLKPLSAYSFTKRDNPTEFNKLLTLLPIGYVNNLNKDIESIDFIYSGSTASPFLLTMAVGRNDNYYGREYFDIDVFNIAPDTGTTASYFSQQWHHFRDENGNRTSYEIRPFIITDEVMKKDVTYATFLTGSKGYKNFI